jgi:secondary thiamine-phosphate synthase enzyme
VPVSTHTLKVRTGRRGLHEITPEVEQVVARAAVAEGMCTVFMRHTSASLTIQENADPSARADLETFLDRLVPEGASWMTHTAEGDDDMPSHIKSVLTQVSVSIPIVGGTLALGTWQGVYVWEHRDHRSSREILVSVSS